MSCPTGRCSRHHRCATCMGLAPATRAAGQTAYLHALAAAARAELRAEDAILHGHPDRDRAVGVFQINDRRRA